MKDKLSDGDILGTLLHHQSGEDLLLLPDKAIWMPEHDILLIADVHLGKISHFRKHGIGLPQNAMMDNMNRLSMLVDSIEPSRVIFLGDLFHSSFNGEWMMLREYMMSKRETSFELIIVNHDILDNSVYEQSYKTTSRAISIGKLILTHEPIGEIPTDKYNLYGHIHPAVRLNGKGKQSLRLPCYYFAEHHGIMPAFGTFTGMHTITPSPQDHVFVIADDRVIDVTS